MKHKVTVYIPTHNYGRFLDQSIQSVLAQSLQDWELIIIDDGSTDDSARIADRYKEQDPHRITVIKNREPFKLQACANLALKIAKGEYIMRLDADDYLDENALFVLSNYLDRNREVALVYPNYIYINESGEVMAVENRKKIGEEVKLLDLPAHGACTLIRKRVLKSVGGYSEKYDVQDGYDLWLKVLHRYPVGNVQTPLFYYRQHGKSQTRNEERILEARGKIKRERVKLNEGSVQPFIVAIIGAKNTYEHLPNIVLSSVGGKLLIDHTLESAVNSGIFDRIVVSTDDPRVQEYCHRFERVIVLLRPADLSERHVTTQKVVLDAVCHLEHDHNFYPDILVQLNIHAPLRRPAHVQKAIDTLLLYNSDMVISTYEDFDLHYIHGKYGLEALSKTRHEQLRIEREALYASNNALRVTWRDALKEDDLSKLKIGHITMLPSESYQIRTMFDVWLMDKILLERQKKTLEQLPEMSKMEVRK